MRICKLTKRPDWKEEASKLRPCKRHRPPTYGLGGRPLVPHGIQRVSVARPAFPKSEREPFHTSLPRADEVTAWCVAPRKSLRRVPAAQASTMPTPHPLIAGWLLRGRRHRTGTSAENCASRPKPLPISEFRRDELRPVLPVRDANPERVRSAGSAIKLFQSPAEAGGLRPARSSPRFGSKSLGRPSASVAMLYSLIWSALATEVAVADVSKECLQTGCFGKQPDCSTDSTSALFPAGAKT